MKIREIKSKQRWSGFLEKVKNKTFLQSWSWGEFQKKRGRDIWRLALTDGGEIVATGMVEKIEARRGRFLLIPHGPNLVSGDKNLVLSKFVERVKELGRGQKASFVRFSPIWRRTEENRRIFEGNGTRPAPIHIHPEASWVLDLGPDEEELLMNMRKSTRYNVRKGIEDENIEVYEGGMEELRLFSRLHAETAQRYDFVPFSLSYLENEFSSFSSDGEISLYVARYKGEVGAMAFVIFWSGIGFYHHAVLKPEFRDYPLSYRLLWEGIKEARRRRFFMFDFWGYAPPKSDHPWAGPTFFKMGFGGRKKEYVKTRDLVLSPFYWLDYVVESIRRRRRGF